MHPALDVAYQLLRLAAQRNLQLTPMQLIKLVYICHGWMLGFTKQPLIIEDVEAWKYGPVIPSIYHTFKSYRNQPIIPPFFDISSQSFTDVENAILEGVLNRYGSLSGPQLSTLTHAEGTPWKQTWETWGKYAPGVVIPQKLIEQHYADRINARTNQ